MKNTSINSKFLFLCLAWGFYSHSFAQSIPNPYQPFARPTPVADSVLYCQNMAEWFELTPQFNTDSVWYYFNKSEQLVKKKRPNHDKELAVIYKKRAAFYYKLQMLKECEAFAQKALNYYTTAHTEEALLGYQIKYLLAIAKLFGGDNKNALRLFLEAEKFVLNDTNKVVQAQYFNNKSYFYHIYDIDTQDAEILNYANKSLKIYKQLNRPEDYSAIGRLYSRVSNFYSGKDQRLLLYYLNESEKFALKSQDPYFLLYHILVREEMQLREKKYDEAQKLLTEGMAHLEHYKLTQTNYYQYCLQYMGDIFLAKKQWNTAIQYHEKAYTLASRTQYQKQSVYNLKMIAEVYKQKGDFKNAFLYYKKFADENLTIEKQKSERSLKEYDLEKDILTKQNDLEKATNNRNLLIGGIILMLIFVAFIYYNFSSQKRLNTLLKTRNAEKDLLLKEIHHRVKNNLTVISSLLESQSFDTENEQIKASILAGQSRVKSIALIHQKLYQNEDLASVDFSSFLEELFRQISAIFSSAGQQVHFKNNIPNLLLDIDTAVPLGLISNELFTNSFKYAFDASTVGQILVSLNQTNQDTYQLIYQDNGKGLPEHINFAKSKTMGLRLIQRLAKQLSGKATHQMSNSYSSFIIEFKSLESRKLE